MKHSILPSLLLVIIISCTTADQSKNSEENNPAQATTENTAVEENKNFIEINSNEALIATALMAAPEESRAGCKVIGYNMNGDFVTHREGDNEFIVLVDDPNKEGFNAACYHKDLEPFMARGRALKAEGKSHQEIFDIREAEVKSGELEITTGLTLHIYYGTKSMYNPETSEVQDAQLRYVVYMPWATSESTGLPLNPHAPNHPWIMNPGSHRAHIMITPLSKD